MNSNRLPAFLVGLAVVLFLAYSSLFVVNEREQALVIRFGEIQSVKSEPGLYFKLPFAFMRIVFSMSRSARCDLISTISVFR